MNKPQTFIFVGRSGAGKGTQIELLQKYMKERSPETNSYLFVMGNTLRNFMKNDGYAQEVIRSTINGGNLVPDCISSSMFVSTLLDDLKQDEDLYIDGIPRSTRQSDTIISILRFYNRTNVCIVDIDLSSEEAEKRMLLRGRADDTKEGIASRFVFYEKTVIPAIEYLKENSGYKYLKINGDRSIEEIHKDLIAQLEAIL